MFLVEFFLHGPAAGGFGDGLFQAVGHVVCEQEHCAVHVTARAAHRLDEAPVVAQESFLVGVEYGHHAHFGQVQSFAKQVDAHQHVEFPGTQAPDEFVAFQRLDIAVQVARADARFHKKVGEVLRHLLGEGRHQHAVAVLDDFLDAVQEHVHLALDGEHLDFRVQKSGGSVNLFGNDAARLGKFVIAGGCRHEKHLFRVHVLEFGKVHRAVVQRAGEAEPVLHKRCLAGFVAFGHAAHLRNAHVGFVHHQKPVVAEVVDKRERARTRGAVLDNAGVVLDAAAHAGLANHFHVVAGAAAESGRFQYLAFFVQLCEALGQFHLHALQDSRAAFFLRYEVLCRSDGHLVRFLRDFAGNEVEAHEPVHLVAEQFDAEPFFVVARVNFNHVAVHAETAALQAEIVSRILDSHQVVQNLVPVVNVAFLDAHHQVEVFAGASQTVDAAHGGHDNHVATGE